MSSFSPCNAALPLALALALAWGPRAVAGEPVHTPAPSEHRGISSARYISAGLVGTLVGYGAGHAIAGEWTHFGWICTAGEVTPLLVGVTTGVFARLDNGDSSDNLLPAGLLVGYGVFRVIELVDIWTRPKVRDDSATSSSQAAWAALPLPNRHGAQLVFAGSF
jgi:hypothetical protein